MHMNSWRDYCTLFYLPQNDERYGIEKGHTMVVCNAVHFRINKHPLPQQYHSFISLESFPSRLVQLDLNRGDKVR